MTFNHSNTIAIARTGCVECSGLGMRSTRMPTGERGDVPCGCSLRAIFRACFQRFKHCAAKQDRVSTLSLETWGAHGPRRSGYTRQNELYMADFCNVAKRSLTPEEHQVFKFHYLLGASWSLCSRRLGLNRGDFFHMVYRIEEKLGRVFATLQPYALYPLGDYFGDVAAHAAPFMPRPLEVKNILRPPWHPMNQAFPVAA
jgi:hypothetical protein